ncbi:MAG TPA: DUF559 domain-containing protein [Mycobacterium sp.]|nr:DUF559 domain-containing protein [Mycobacterium sp.]
MKDVFVGSEALRCGDITPYQLRRWHRTIYPDVYVDKKRQVSLHDKIVGAWLWSGRRAVIAGVAASAVHGARWVSGDTRVELICGIGRPPCDLIVRHERLADHEVTIVDGLPVTTVARTAFDLGRHLPRGQAVARLDALALVTDLSADDVLALTQHYKGLRGVRRCKAALALMDRGAESPKETWLRLLLIDAGLPPPTTQILVHNGDFHPLAYLDMGWEEFRVAVEYDGDQHRSDRRQYLKDRSRLAMLEQFGWIVVRVVAEDHPNDIVARVYTALAGRGLPKAA